MSEKRKLDEPRAAEATKRPPSHDNPQPKRQDEELDEQALDDVLRECPL